MKIRICKKSRTAIHFSGSARFCYGLRFNRFDSNFILTAGNLLRENLFVIIHLVCWDIDGFDGRTFQGTLDVFGSQFFRMNRQRFQTAAAGKGVFANFLDVFPDGDGFQIGISDKRI